MKDRLRPCVRVFVSKVGLNIRLQCICYGLLFWALILTVHI